MWRPFLFLSDRVFLPLFAGAFCRDLRERRGSGEQKVSGRFQEVDAGRDDAVHRGAGGLLHRSEAPVRITEEAASVSTQRTPQTYMKELLL